ncbi:hypothetical protein B0I35DRAFT_230980 [Stachybotrys elegans]|uniref:Uncharacterized protein n=1 Tax=Stachybotrys elegans TaxID=80388 RepID=A0A8K0SYC1_9HYPO|nr:hypothetical protein B0I35DRAFT_230980 [Stachybotrys elegans]
MSSAGLLVHLFFAHSFLFPFMYLLPNAAMPFNPPTCMAEPFCRAWRDENAAMLQLHDLSLHFRFLSLSLSSPIYQGQDVRTGASIRTPSPKAGSVFFISLFLLCFLAAHKYQKFNGYRLEIQASLSLLPFFLKRISQNIRLYRQKPLLNVRSLESCLMCARDMPESWVLVRGTSIGSATVDDEIGLPCSTPRRCL